jgi:hypothetical protein
VATEILDLLNVPRELTLRFLAVFSRYEYALKRAGYVQGDESKISADWDTFARDVSTLDPSLIVSVLDSCAYLRQYPPKKQVLKDCRLQWVQRKGSVGSAIGDVLLSVRTVRNNVFHGGKFPEGPVVEPLRDEQLIRECLAVLEILLTLPLPNQVAEHFKS